MSQGGCALVDFSSRWSISLSQETEKDLLLKFFSSVAAAVLALKPRSASAPPLFVSNDAAARRFAHRIKRGHVRRGQRGVIIRCAAGVPVGLHELDRCAKRGGASSELR